MLPRVVGFLVVVVMAGVTVLVWATTPPQDKGDFEDGLVYRSVGDTELALDLARPAGEGPFPAVVCLHPGGWVSGSRKLMTNTLGVLAKRGYVAVAPDYRLAPKHRYPACLEDCKAALAWLRSHAKKYRVDPKRIGLIGLSAGGHLALMTALEGGQVQAVCVFSAPCDLSDAKLTTEETVKRNLKPLLGGGPETHGEAYKKASPFYAEVQGVPPVLLMVGSEDQNVPPSQSEAFARKVNRAGGAARVVILQGEGHTWKRESLMRSIGEMLLFLDDTLRHP
ncbi:MAG: alpha/beta hydrolase [Gemmataceae bacterium]